MKKNDYKKPPFSLDRTRYGDLAAQLASSLRTAIETGYYRAGDILPPVRELAKLLGVSAGIAARALSIVRDEGLINPRPCVGSVVCAKGQPLWKGHVVIVVPPGPGNRSDNTVHSRLRDTLTAEGYLTTPVTVAETRTRLFNDFSLLDAVLRQQTDLVVLLHNQDNIARWLSRRGTDFVRFTLGAFSPPHCRGLVRRDDYAAMPPFLARCRETGVRRVIQVMGFPCADLTGPLGEAGIHVETMRYPRWKECDDVRPLSDWTLEAFRRRFAQEGRKWLPDLLFFNDDHFASSALLALSAAGVRIPEDVRVATWANRDYGPSFLKPLTRMEMDNAAIGATLADCVLQCLRTGTFPQGVVVGPKYVTGETF